TLASTTTEPAEVTVIGPSTSVGLVQVAVADVNLTGVRSDIRRQYELSARDDGGAIQPRVRLQPSSAEVQMNIEQLETPQVVPVQVQIQGEIAAGYNVINIEPDPWNILLSGSLETLQNLDFVRTEPIDVSGASTTITRSARLQIPDGIQAQRQNVTVTIEIVPAPGSRALTVAPVVTNVPNGLNAVIQTTFVTVRVSGETPVLNQLTAADITVTL